MKHDSEAIRFLQKFDKSLFPREVYMCPEEVWSSWIEYTTSRCWRDLRAKCLIWREREWSGRV